ncbi:MAG: hypothetical protein ACM3U2_13275 [Deltaproteobacteria bacterium]
MLRPIAAGWMCLGFVTLGVAATWGQDEGGKPENVDATVVEQAAGEAAPASDAAVPVKEGDLRRIEIRIGEDGAAAIVGEGEKRAEVREGGEVIVVEGKDGKVVQRIPVNPQYAPIQARVRLAGPAVVDPGTREALEKLIAGLNDEVKKLESEGKKEEVEKKQQSIRALEQILNPVPHWAASARQLMPREGAMFGRRARIEAAGPAAEEMKKLQARMDELRAQMSRIPEGDKEGRGRLEQEMAELKKQMAERHERRIAVFGAQPFPPGFAPGQPLPPGALPPMGAPRGPADALTHKAHALRNAAEQLQRAGLEDQSRELEKQADKLQAEAEKIRAQAPHEPDMVHFRGGPVMDLHRSIHELQEQVQQLRKEIAEIRELLQRQK